jgi:hypothetical protein
MTTKLAPIDENPFYLLGLRPDCSRADVEREGTKLLGMLELGLLAAKTYATPSGTAQRDADAVRKAMAELREPRRRLLHELWAQLPVAKAATPSAAPAVTPAAAGSSDVSPPQAPAAEAWPEALAALGFGVRP